jgi:hypothetical protein
MNVFISYRRSDTQDLAGRIADRLRAFRQIGKVFIDVEAIEAGADFVARLQSALAESDVCVVLIGPNWRGRRDDGSARILEERDFVRLEVAGALATQRKVLPVLATGAAMPQADELPGELKRLAGINALSIRHAYFDHDIELLLDALLSRRKPGRVGMYFRQHPIQAGVLHTLGGISAAVALLVVAAAVHTALTQRSLEETLGGQAQVWLLIVATIAIGGGAGLVTVLRGK